MTKTMHVIPSKGKKVVGLTMQEETHRGMGEKRSKKIEIITPRTCGDR
jgi:hypothetical protein